MSTPLEKYEKMKEQCRIRANRFYEKNKEKIGLKREELRIKTKLQKKKSCVVINFEMIKGLLENESKIESENTRKAHINRMKTFFEITSCKDINVCLLDYTIIIDSMNDATYGINDTPYKINSKKNIMESFLFCLDNLDIHLDKSIREKYQDYYSGLKISSNDELEDKKNDDSNAVISWNEYETKVKEKFGTESKEYLLIKLYEICNARDDFDLYITSDIESVKDDKTKNYLIREENNNYLLCMQCYKTSKNKDPIFIKVTPELKILLDNYIKLHHLVDRLFPTKSGSNSSFISTMNKKIDVKGAINTIRHIIISTGLSSNMSPEEKVLLSKNSFHSINTQIAYKRKIENKNKNKK